MTLAIAAETYLRGSDPFAALNTLQEQVRERPGDAKLRVFLFQLLSVLGQWERAYSQLDVAAQLDPAALAMAQMYREALRCEVVRKEIFAGKIMPTVFGRPEQWLALLVEALTLTGRGKARQAEALRREAFEAAPATAGTLNGQSFEWIADADMRLGPVLETIINGKYYWVPFSRLLRVRCEAPEDLRDLVWMPAHLQLANEGETVALIPTRYPGTELSEDGALLLARKTEWSEALPNVYHGIGQRVLTTNAGDTPVLELRELTLANDPTGSAGRGE